MAGHATAYHRPGRIFSDAARALSVVRSSVPSRASPTRAASKSSLRPRVRAPRQHPGRGRSPVPDPAPDKMSRRCIVARRQKAASCAVRCFAASLHRGGRCVSFAVWLGPPRARLWRFAPLAPPARCARGPGAPSGRGPHRCALLFAARRWHPCHPRACGPSLVACRAALFRQNRAPDRPRPCPPRRAGERHARRGYAPRQPRKTRRGDPQGAPGR